MKRLLIAIGLLLAAAQVQAQKITDPPSSTFGLDDEDAKAVMEIRNRMAAIRRTRPTVALVLSGGGAKGAATVGVLKYMEQYNLPVDMVVGTSIGGLLGGMYALGYSADYLDSLFRHMDWDMVLSDKVARKYQPYSRQRNKEKYLLSFPFYYKADDYKNYIRGEMPFAAGRSRELKLGAESADMSTLARGNLLGSLPSGFVFGQNVNHVISSRTVGYSDSTNFFNLPIPFACVATDMASGKAKIWHSGSINMALRSTMSIPGLFAPVRTNGMVLVDGGMRNNFPANIAKRMGADIIIGVDLSDESPNAGEIQNLADLMMAGMSLFSNDAFEMNQRLLNVHIHPDMTGYGMLSFNADAVDTLYNRGYKAAEAADAEFQELRKKLGTATRQLNAPPAVDIGTTPVLIGDIDVVGVDEVEAEYIKEGMKVKPQMKADRNLIEDDIATIFGRGAYDYVNYELRGEKEPFTLRVSCKRGPMHKIGFSARMDTEELVSLLFNVGLNTNAMRGSSLDITARVSTHPYIDLHYAYNGRRFATFNAVANFAYKGGLHVVNDGLTDVYSTILCNQEIFFSNMHWSHYDMRVGLRNQFYRIFNDVTAMGTLTASMDIPSLFWDGRVETLDNGYFPERGISSGFRGDLVYTGFLPDAAQKLMGILSFDVLAPISFGRFALVPQLQARYVLAQEAPSLLVNYLGGTMKGRYFEQQIPFVGIMDNVAVKDFLACFKLEARYRIGNNHYVSAFGNLAVNSENISSVADATFLGGAGLGYAYNSIAGPLQFQLFWSNYSKTLGAYLSLGYHF